MSGAASVCPPAPSTSSISCWSGDVFTNVPASAYAQGACVCDCNSSQFGENEDVTAAPSAAACNASLCTSAFAMDYQGHCYGNTTVVSARFMIFSDYLQASKPEPAMMGVGALCLTTKFTCTATTVSIGSCPLAWQGAVIARYEGHMAPDALAMCAHHVAAEAPTGSAVTVTACASQLCNVLQTSSAASMRKLSIALLLLSIFL